MILGAGHGVSQRRRDMYPGHLPLITSTSSSATWTHEVAARAKQERSREITWIDTTTTAGDGTS